MSQSKKPTNRSPCITAISTQVGRTPAVLLERAAVAKRT